MARHYSVREFFRQTPNALLARYFHSHGVFHDFDFDGMPEAKTDPLFDAWLGLPDDLKRELEAECREVFEMSDERGFVAIRDEIQWHLRSDPAAAAALVTELAAKPNHFARAMVTYLDHRSYWRGATHFHHADRLPYWRKRSNVPRVPAAVDQASVDRLSDEVRTYFHSREGRGKNCAVEMYRRGDRDYYFCYPEDHTQQGTEWVGDRFEWRPHNPAFEVIFVYSEAEGTLEVNFRGKREVSSCLMEIFARTILGLEELPPEPTHAMAYDLDPLRLKSFHFEFDGASGIESMAVRRLRLSAKDGCGERLVLEANPSEDPAAVYALLERIGNALPLAQYFVTQIEVVASVATERLARPKKIAFTITHPNSCSLKHEGIEGVLRGVLRDSGIEPRPVPTSVDPGNSGGTTP